MKLCFVLLYLKILVVFFSSHLKMLILFPPIHTHFLHPSHPLQQFVSPPHPCKLVLVPMNMATSISFHFHSSTLHTHLTILRGHRTHHQSLILPSYPCFHFSTSTKPVFHNISSTHSINRPFIPISLTTLQ